MRALRVISQLGATAEGGRGDAVLDALLQPVYVGLTRTALTEAEVRYGPYILGMVIGLFAFNIYLGRKVLK